MAKKSTRQIAQRKLDSAILNMDKAGSFINEVSHVYREHHPEISDKLDLGLTLLTEIYSLVEFVRGSF